jgi:polyhydroxyalkanoate synthesis regulator phasin
MTNQDRRPNDLGDNLREGVRTVAGILGALKDAVEESFDELRQRGDLSPERAREAARSTVQRAQEEMEGLRDRLDFVSRRELEAVQADVAALRAEVASLRSQLDTHTRAGGHAAPGGAGSGATGPGGFPVDGG